MGRPTLRRRLYTVLLQWFVLLAIASGAVVVLSASGVRSHLVDDRLRLTRTIARALDTVISTAVRDLGRLSLELPAPDAAAAGRLRVFRFHSPFREATYVLDERANVIVSDPADVRALPGLPLVGREIVTPLLSRAGNAQRLAIVQPFRWQGVGHYLVAEMNPAGSVLGTFLQNLELAPDMHVAVLDANGVVIASPDARILFRALPDAAVFGERIRSHRPLVTEALRGALAADGGPGDAALTIMVPLQFAPWGVVVQQRTAEAFLGVHTTYRNLLAAGALLVVMGLLVTRALWRSVVVPIQHLSQQAERVRAGDLASPITVSGDHEVEVLARTLDEARARLGSTLQELTALNEGLEAQVATRTRVVEAKYRDLTLLHAVAQRSTQERAPDRVMPEILHLIVRHHAFPAAALVTRPLERPAATYVAPAGAVLPWLTEGGPPPEDWQHREIVYQGTVQADLFHPRVAGLDEQVMEALAHQLAISLHGAHLWARTAAQDEQRQLLVRRLLSATEEERRRLARELHDEISQLLTVIQLSLEHVEAESPELEKAKRLLTTTQRDIHRIIYDLRPSLLDDLGLAAAIKSHAQEHLVRHGLHVSLEIEDALPSRPEIEITTFRIYQELVTNILRHAQAEDVSIELYERDGRLILAVEDDGVGFDPGEKSEGVGITGMRERAALVNGTIRFDSEPGLGTHVVLEIPIR
jgi:signal transduction histidine kinase